MSESGIKGLKLTRTITGTEREVGMGKGLRQIWLMFINPQFLGAQLSYDKLVQLVLVVLMKKKTQQSILLKLGQIWFKPPCVGRLFQL